VLAYRDATKCYLDQCVDGTYTNLISQTVSYVAGATLQAVKVGQTVQLFYNDTQIGTDQTIDAGIATNTIHGMFGTYGGNKLDRFFAS
jgi:hypothetical protein